MVKINLLLSGSAKEKPEGAPKIISQVSMILVILAVFFLTTGILLRLVNFYRNKRLPLIDQQYQQAENFAKRITELRKEKGILSDKLDFLDKFLNRDILLSAKLSELGKIIPNEAWLRQLSFEKSEIDGKVAARLYLKGGLVGRGNIAPLEILSLLVEQLQKDQSFSSNLESPVLADSRKEIYNNVEILTFAIEIPLKNTI